MTGITQDLSGETKNKNSKENEKTRIREEGGGKRVQKAQVQKVQKYKVGKYVVCFTWAHYGVLDYLTTSTNFTNFTIFQSA